MKDEVIDKIFRSRSNMFTAIALRDALEETIAMRFITRNRNFDSSFLDARLEENGTQLFRGILNTFNPEMFRNLRNRNAKEIWRKYWSIRSHFVTTKISALTFLVEINKNPY